MLVSIIITNHNYGEFIAEAIESALNQDYANVEVIVVDDESTDESRSVIQQYENRLKAIYKDWSGQCASFNAGFAVSHGDVVISLDADDVLLPYAVSLHAQRMRKGVVKSCGYMDVVDAAGNRLNNAVPNRLLRSGNYLQKTLQNGLDCYQTSFTSGHAWSRDFLNVVMPLPEDNLIGVDGYLTAVDRFFGDIEFIHEPVVKYRMHFRNKGPSHFRFDVAYMENRLMRKRHRLDYAEDWTRRLGLQVNEKGFREVRDWRLTLMQYSLHLMGNEETTLPFFDFVIAPLKNHPLKLWSSLRVSLIFLTVRLLPAKQGLRVAQYVLTKTQLASAYFAVSD